MVMKGIQLEIVLPLWLEMRLLKLSAMWKKSVEKIWAALAVPITQLYYCL